jgi:hypothetical protein
MARKGAPPSNRGPSWVRGLSSYLLAERRKREILSVVEGTGAHHTPSPPRCKDLAQEHLFQGKVKLVLNYLDYIHPGGYAQ